MTSGNETQRPELKIVVLGDVAVGKTNMLISYNSMNPRSECMPLIFEVEGGRVTLYGDDVMERFEHRHLFGSEKRGLDPRLYSGYDLTTQSVCDSMTRDSVTLLGMTVCMNLWDTKGQEDYDKWRPLSYNKADAFLVCFSLANIGSYESIVERWIPEIRHHGAKTPVILVGTKSDLRESGQAAICRDEGEKLKAKIKAHAYVECSAKTREGINEVFEEAVRAVLEARMEKSQKKKPKCRVL